jgi:hypothetical protein
MGHGARAHLLRRIPRLTRKGSNFSPPLLKTSAGPLIYILFDGKTSAGRKRIEAIVGS